MGFLRKFATSLNFLAYERFTESKISDSFKYLAKIILVFFVISCLLYIPKLITLSDKLDKDLGKFSNLTIKVDGDQKEPVILFEKDSRRMVTIDKESNATEVAEGKYLVTSENVVKKTWLGTEVTSIEGYSNVIAHKDFYKAALFVLLLFILPGIILFGYLACLIKYIVLALIVSFLILIVVRLIRYEIAYRQVLNATIYAFTITVMVELLIMPFGDIIPYVRVGWVALLLGIIWASLGVSRIGFFDRRKGGSQKARRRGYIELE